MTIQEFQRELGATVSNKDYPAIEYVYTFHPSISNTEGKKQIANLYRLGGMRLIKDMLPTAKRAEELESKIRKTNANLAQLKKQYEDLQYGKESEE